MADSDILLANYSVTHSGRYHCTSVCPPQLCNSITTITQNVLSNTSYSEYFGIFVVNTLTYTQYKMFFLFHNKFYYFKESNSVQVDKYNTGLLAFSICPGRAGGLYSSQTSYS